MRSQQLTNSSTLTITRVEQARLLADPIKLRIIQQMTKTPHTTKQVAETLGEKPTKLYRHVEALREAGLIELVAEKPKRGTVEKYFLAVARRFEIHPDLFAAPGESGVALLDEFLSGSFSEIRAAINEVQADPPDKELAPCFLKFAVHANEKDIKELRSQLLAWLEGCQSRNHEDADASSVKWSGFIAFYPDTTNEEANEN